MPRINALLAVVIALTALPALALESVNQDRKGVAIHGFDPVAYFELQRAVRGDAAHAFEWNGATWWFTSAEHRALFTEAPERYAPRYGGYCAKAVSEAHTADIDPEAWDVVNGKLYLNYSKKVQKLWREDPQDRIRRADENWPKLLAAK